MLKHIASCCGMRPLGVAKRFLASCAVALVALTATPAIAGAGEIVPFDAHEDTVYTLESAKGANSWSSGQMKTETTGFFIQIKSLTGTGNIYGQGSYSRNGTYREAMGTWGPGKVTNTGLFRIHTYVKETFNNGTCYARMRFYGTGSPLFAKNKISGVWSPDSRDIASRPFLN